MIRAAGILFTAGETALFLRRGNGSSMPNLWCIPGGKQEEGEDALQTAIRETREECGQRVAPTVPRLWTRTLSGPSEGLGQASGATEGPHPAVPTDPQEYPEQVDFTTFIVRLTNQFTPIVDPEEHDGYAWAPITAPPEPLHPGVRIALQRFTMNELDVAEAMAAGTLTSPQRYENVWLFAMRITGTGMSYRSGRNEYVIRDPLLYTNDRFLKRCNGLQVIWDHPEDGKLLDDAEFKSRTIGSIFLPYLRPDKPDEVWGIAKIYDDEAAELMCEDKLSTSPAVNFRNPHVNEKVELGDGEVLLIEGDPSLIDHLAVCQNGVWDKGGDPSGIDSITAEEGIVLDSNEDNDGESHWITLNGARIKVSGKGEVEGGAEGKLNGQKLSKHKDYSESQKKEALAKWVSGGQEGSNAGFSSGGVANKLNNSLRNGKGLNEKAQEMVNVLDSLFRDVEPTKEDMVLYRGSEEDVYNGDRLTDKGYASTSPDRSIAEMAAGAGFGEEETLYVIKIPKGSRVVNVNSILGENREFSDENEHLLPRGSRFERGEEKEENGQKVVELTYIPPDDSTFADSQKIDDTTSSVLRPSGVDLLYAQAAAFSLKTGMAKPRLR